MLWAPDCFNRSVTKANIGWRSPYEVFLLRPPELPVVPFSHRYDASGTCYTRSGVQLVPCDIHNNDCNHPSSIVNAIKASMGGICSISDAMWTIPRALTLPAPASGGVQWGLPCPCPPPRRDLLVDRLYIDG